ncbi:MAG: hypothetical protein ABWY77_09435 [Acidimicrobiia bacterium]
MRALRLLLVSAMACGALLVFAPASGAAVPAASKVCSLSEDLQADLGNTNASTAAKLDSNTFKKTAAAFKKAAKSAPAKVKSAMNTLASYYSALGGSKDEAELLAAMGKNGEKFSKATTTFITYIATNCTGT